MRDAPPAHRDAASGLYGFFDRSVGRNPDGIALEIGDLTLRYAELADLVDRFAARLAMACGDRPRRVGILAARCPAAYVAYLASLRLGATVVPLGPAFPPTRNRRICLAAEVDVVATQDDPFAHELGPPVAELPAGAVRSPPAIGAGLGPVAPVANPLAYLLFTSGSTGRPKGVLIRHDNVTGYIADAVRRYRVDGESRLSQTFDLTFDPSVLDLFTAWGGGAALVVPSPEEILLPARLVAARALTHWSSVPSVITLAGRLRGLSPNSMPGLRFSLFCGEQLGVEQARAWARAAPASVIENLYGPTELTITCTRYRLGPDPVTWPALANGAVPIGEPNAGLEWFLLGDGHADPYEGELCVRGVQRFPGYLEPSDDIGSFVGEAGDGARIYDGTAPLTAADWYRTGDRVRSDPEHGLVFLGRLDGQLKMNGYRVELGEIEAVARDCPGIEQVAVTAVEDDAGRQRPFAWYVGATVTEDDLRAWLATRLPPYMLPSGFVRCDTLPRNANGKLDRSRLTMP
jgi:amino acid adenylation domain-containing protein